MRKLAVTVFAVSLFALGCGSDEGTPAKTDAAPKTDAPALGPDSPVLGPDSPVLGPDSPVLGPDSPVLGPDSPVLGPDSPVLGPDSPVLGPDGAGTAPETPKTDVTPVVDGVAPADLPPPRLDAQELETGDRPSQPIDGGADAQASEAAPLIDGGSVVDGGVQG